MEITISKITTINGDMGSTRSPWSGINLLLLVSGIVPILGCCKLSLLYTEARWIHLENDPDASGNVSSNYENNEVNTYPLNSSELNAATERKLSLLSSHTSAEHVISEQDDPTYVLVDTNVWKNLLCQL
ncbi:hypothetical protein TNCT_274961 [Trichonephila clavata]|uniref:Uncharacterized protein n=1 Tax=Trichonephila clavata TaxID=2740835 RepID=A0A8X6F6N7_TRICU|nr:hypothetical protein TNCT_274961 [Trichonephila clavata]